MALQMEHSLSSGGACSSGQPKSWTCGVQEWDWDWWPPEKRRVGVEEGQAVGAWRQGQGPAGCVHGSFNTSLTWTTG